jgi:hypothetical protein
MEQRTGLVGKATTSSPPLPSTKRRPRTHVEQAVSFLRHVTKSVKNGYAWKPSPLLKAHPGKQEPGLYLCCQLAPQDESTFCGFRLWTNRAKKPQQCAPTKDCPYCLFVDGAQLRKVVDVMKNLGDPNARLYTFVEPPAFASVVNPGCGVLVKIPAKAGSVTIVFSGVCYFIKCSEKDSEYVSERRLPKNHQDQRVTCDDDDQLVHGIKGSKHPEVLVQLTFRAPAYVALFVPSQESSPWREDDPDKAFSTRPGYVYNVVSSKSAHTFSEFAAADLWTVLANATVTEARRRGMKRTREEETVLEKNANATEEDFPIPSDDGLQIAEVLEVDEAMAPSSLFTASSLESLFQPRMGEMDIEIDRSGSFLSTAIRREPLPHSVLFPRFHLEPSDTPHHYRVLSEYRQHALIWPHDARDVTSTLGLTVRTTGTYFCRVQETPDGFQLIVEFESNAPLSNLDDTFFTGFHDGYSSIDQWREQISHSELEALAQNTC